MEANRALIDTEGYILHEKIELKSWLAILHVFCIAGSLPASVYLAYAEKYDGGVIITKPIYLTVFLGILDLILCGIICRVCIIPSATTRLVVDKYTKKVYYVIESIRVGNLVISTTLSESFRESEND